MTILKTSGSIRKAITWLMRPGRVRRVAIAAFVGDGARAFLPRAKGIDLICWPKAGGTNPLELRRLKKLGARIRFADRLHMKLYWAANRGTIITSANLSTNALGAGGLKEVGVLLPPDVVDIDALIVSLKSRPFNKAQMQKLEEAHRKMKARGLRPTSREERVEYPEWYGLPARSEWKLGWWVEYGEFGKEAVQTARRDFNRREPESSVLGGKQHFRKDDWVLTFRVGTKGISKAEWMYVDFVARVRRTEKAYEPDYPYQAVQVWTPRHYASPPFVITRAFRTALSAACLRLGIQKIKNLRKTPPPARLLQILAREMKRRGRTNRRRRRSVAPSLVPGHKRVPTPTK
jgi:hypothetical protein